MPRVALAATIALAGSLLGGDAAAQPVAGSPGAPAPPVTAVAVEATLAPEPPPPPDPAPWAHTLPALLVRNANTGAQGTVRLYRDDGTVDDLAADTFTQIASGESETSLDRRLVQLVFKAAYHFGVPEVWSISAWRPTKKGKGNKHASGEAIDFKLPGIRTPQLANYLFTMPRAGVGWYTHPRTQYVHLDVRDESYHWVDGSPPGVTWRERGLPDWGKTARDAGWTRDFDLPTDAAPGSAH
jgi:hypothetical protein